MTPADYNTEKEAYTRVSRSRLNGIVVLLGERKKGTLLDVGCGAGEVGHSLKTNHGATVFGIDVSPQAIERAVKVLDGASVCNLEEATVLPDGIGKRQYDALIVSEVLEHLIEPEKLLQKLRTFSSAPIIVTVPNVLFWKNRLKILLGHFSYTETGLMDKGHIHFFSWESLGETIAEGGYTIDAIQHHIPTRGTKILGRYFPGMFAYQFIIRIVPSVN